MKSLFSFKWILILSIALCIFILDQVTKYWINQNITYDMAIHVIPGIFDIIHTRNKGAAFGFMANMPEHIRMPFFFISSIAALVGMVFYFSKSYPDHTIIHISLGLVLGGAFGNIYDRITLGEVIDFLSFHYYDKWADFNVLGYQFNFRLEWPAFNIADSAICVAMGLIMLCLFKEEKKKGVILP